MSVWLASVDKYQPAIWHQGALQLVGRGFLCPEHLDGLQPKDVARFSADEKVKCLLQAALQSACRAARLRRKHIASQVEAGRPVAASAEAAATLVRSSQAAADTYSATFSTPLRGPQAVTKELASSESEVLLTLQHKADTLKLCSQQDRGPSGLWPEGMAPCSLQCRFWVTKLQRRFRPHARQMS